MMELQHMRLGGFRPVYTGLLRQEETLESIVPDALPDMKQIIEASGVALLRQKETVDGSVRVTGSARVTVLYQPEGEQPPCSLVLSIPFLCSEDQPVIREGHRTLASVQVLHADARMLNPRKILVRIDVAAAVSVCAEENSEVCTGVGGEDSHSLQTLTERHRNYMMTDICDKSFSFSDVLRLPAAKQAVSLLNTRAEITCVEAKVIGKKLVVKGEVTLTGRYLHDGGTTVTRFDLPFSQILELSVGGDDCDVRTETALTGMSCELRSDSELEVKFDLLLQAAVFQEQELDLLADLYSTSVPIEVVRDTLNLCSRVDQGAQRQSIRQICAAEIPARSVTEYRLTLGELEQAPAGDERISATVKTYADILCVSEENELFSMSCIIPVTCELPVRPGDACICRCALTGERSALPTADGIDLRFNVEFSYLSTNENCVHCVSAVRPGQEDPAAGERPSLVIRMLGEGERLWDVAKSCGSTVADIRSANALDDADAASGTLLLIPRCR